MPDGRVPEQAGGSVGQGGRASGTYQAEGQENVIQNLPPAPKEKKKKAAWVVCVSWLGDKYSTMTKLNSGGIFGWFRHMKGSCAEPIQV